MAEEESGFTADAADMMLRGVARSIEVDTEELRTLLQHAGFELARYPSGDPYLTHAGTGITLRVHTQRTQIHYPAKHAERHLAVVDLARDCSLRATADVACALRMTLERRALTD